MSQYVISSLEQQWRKDPSSRVFFRLAEEYRKSGAFEKAIDVCKDGIKFHPNYLPARVCLGRCRQAMGLLHQAEEDFHEVLRTAPDNPHALLGLSTICFESGRLEESLTYAETMAIHDPYDEALVNRILFIKEKIAERELEEPELVPVLEPVYDVDAPFLPVEDADTEPMGEPSSDAFEDQPDLLGVTAEEADPLDAEFAKAIEDDESIGEFEDLTTEAPAVKVPTPLGAEEEHLLTKGLKHEKMEHYEAAQHIYRSLLVDHPGNPTVRQHLDRVDRLLTIESGSRKKIRLLSNWLDKIKGVYYVS